MASELSGGRKSSSQVGASRDLPLLGAPVILICRGHFSVYVWWDVFHIKYQHLIFGVHVGYRLFVYRQHLQLEVAVRCGSVYWAEFGCRIDDCPDLYDVPDFCNLGVVAEYRVDSGEVQPTSLPGFIVVLDERLE